MSARPETPRQLSSTGGLALAALAALTLLVAGSSPASAAEPFELRADRSYDLGTPPADPDLNRLDLYLPAEPAAGRAPIVVYVHGGGWSIGDKSNRAIDKARMFTRNGYLFASLNYRLSPDPPETGNADRIRFPAHPHDVGEAIGWLRRNAAAWGADPERIVLLGHSAGSHLVSLVGTSPAFLRAYGTEPDAIRGVVSLDTAHFDIAGRADPETSTLNLSGRISIWNAIGGPAENAVDGSWQAASPLDHADRRDPPHLFVTQQVPGRIADNAEMAAALGHGADSVVAVANDHAGINTALGRADDETGETEAVIGFVRDALATDSAPRTKLDRKPPGKLRLKGTGKGKDRKRRVRFRFSAADERARFDCRIDRRRWRACSSPSKYRLGRGKHRFRVRSKTRDGKGPVRGYRFRIQRR